MKLIGAAFCIVVLFACRKDPKINAPEPIEPDPCALLGYTTYSTTSFDSEKKDLSTPVPFGPFMFNPNPDGRKFSDAVINPNNNYEIAYVYLDTSMTGLYAEVWKFNFCTGQNLKIADNFQYNLDWSEKGWLLYTGTGNEIFKVKENGDSLTQMSNLSGFNIAGKWSPDGTKYYITGDNGLRIYDEAGNLLNILTVGSFGAFDWMDNDHLVGWRNFNFYSLNINDEALIQLTSHWTCSTCPTIYDRKHNTMFLTLNMGTGSDDYFLKYDLTMNTVDTVAILYDSYQYSSGSYIDGTDKIVTTLVRKHWKDSLMNEVYVRSDLLIVNPDATGERLIVLPQ